MKIKMIFGLLILITPYFSANAKISWMRITVRRGTEKGCGEIIFLTENYHSLTFYVKHGKLSSAHECVNDPNLIPEDSRWNTELKNIPNEYLQEAQNVLDANKEIFESSYGQCTVMEHFDPVAALLPNAYYSYTKITIGQDSVTIKRVGLTDKEKTKIAKEIQNCVDPKNIIRKTAKSLIGYPNKYTCLKKLAELLNKNTKK